MHARIGGKTRGLIRGKQDRGNSGDAVFTLYPIQILLFLHAVSEQITLE